MTYGRDSSGHDQLVFDLTLGTIGHEIVSRSRRNSRSNAELGRVSLGNVSFRRTSRSTSKEA